MAWWSRPGLRALAGLLSSAFLLGLYSRGGIAFALGFVALLPWLVSLDTMTSATACLRSAWLMSLAFMLAVFAWFAVAIGDFSGWGTAAGVLVLLLAAPLLQTQILVFALVRYYVGRRHGPLLRALSGACAWVGTEWLLPRLLGDSLGHGLYPAEYLRQVADIGGVAGLTFALLLVNEGLAYAWSQRGRGLPALWGPLLFVVALPLLMSAYGRWQLASLDGFDSNAEKLRIGLVQSNLYDYENLRRKIGAYGVVRQVLDTHYALSREALQNGHVDALLWSETVYPTTFAHPKSEGGAELDREILDFVDASGVPLVFGTYDRDDQGEYNAAAFVEPKAGLIGFYRKTNLFPLTELVPAWLDGPMLRRLLPWAGTWNAGNGARVFPLRLADGREIPVLPLICLDDVDSDLGIAGARLGARAILTMSNDSWFTHYPVGADLHLAVAAFRSIETRLPQWRVTANGRSALIDASGSVVAEAAVAQPTQLVASAELIAHAPGLLLRWGNWVGPSSLLFLFLLALNAARVWIQRRRATAPAPMKASKSYEASASLLGPGWRVLAGVLRVCSWIGLAWFAWTLLSGASTQIKPLAQLQMFAALVVAPQVAAWAIAQAHAARLRVEAGALRIEQAGQGKKFASRDIAGVRVWNLPLPGPGVSLKLLSGRSLNIATADPSALVQALLEAGASLEFAPALSRRALVFAHLRASTPRWRIDHPAIKFLLFPLVPALPAFRLHQHIAYGSTFGEYYSFGLKAYLSALLIWWASWAIGLSLYAAFLRVLVEAGSLATLELRPDRAGTLRQYLESAARLLYYVGAPSWLLVRVLFE